MRLLRLLRLHEGSGQGLVEVTGVIGTFVLLLAVGLPSYFGLQNEKAAREARSKLLAAVPAAETYRVQRGSYTGLDTVKLKRIDPRVSQTLVVASVKRGRYCLMETVHGQVWSVSGPFGQKAKFKPGACSR
jgi:Tfp pilus assembly protein PilE